MKLIVKKGRTSLLVKIFIQDATSVTGAGLAGLTSASGGLVCYRARDDDGNAAATQIALSAGTRGTWTSGGFVEKDSTNMPGVYELGIPDVAIASGSETAIVMLKGATNMAPTVLEIQLVAYDPQDTVRAGLTALPNAAAAASGGLLTFGSGSGQLNPASGKVDIAGDFRIRKNTALAAFPFRMTDSADHATPKTGLTVTGQVSLNGGAFAALTNAVVEIASGWYKVDLAAADVNADTVALKFTGTGADQLDITIATQTE
jgi:hypothetical protein